MYIIEQIPITAFGIYELSAVNSKIAADSTSWNQCFISKGVVGSFAEIVSEVHIVGTSPAIPEAKSGIFYHTIVGNDDFRDFKKRYVYRSHM